MYRVLLWGAGIVYNQHLNTLKLYERVEQLQIIGIVAESLKDVASLDSYTVYTKKSVANLEYDYLIIMNERYFEDILKEVLDLGVQNEKILSYKLLEIPNLDFKEYLDIKKRNISIISNTCWGGVAYKHLGLECLSPFKNLFIKDFDYIKLLSDFRYYMELPLEFDHYEVGVGGSVPYPVMRLGNVYVHCNHETEYETAIEKWERRKKKLNYNELYVEMYTKKVEVAECFSELEGFKNKLCFVPFDTELEYCMKLDSGKNLTEFWSTVINSVNAGTEYSLLDWLTGKESIQNRRG